MLVIACGGWGVPHAETARPTIVAIGRGRGPLKALLANLFVPFDALLGAVGGDVRWCLPVAARGCLPASLGRAKHGLLIAGGVLGGDATRLLERVPEEVAMSTLSRALHVALGQRAHATLVSLAACLGLDAPFLPP
jgi:hypothetical protein